MRSRICLWLFVFVLSISVPVNAVEFQGVEVIEDYEIPDSFKITIHEVCSGHGFFYQVSAREDGSCLVLYRHADNPASDTIFGTVYLDLFAPDGSFLYELTFDTQDDCVAEYTPDRIVLYFYDHIIEYNPDTGVCNGYRTVADASREAGIYQQLRKSHFSCGEWEYTCTKTFFNRTGLARTNGTDTQTLLSLPGTGLTMWNTVIPIVFLTVLPLILGVLLPRWLRKKRDSTA